MPNKSINLSMDAVYGKPGYLFRRIQQIAVAIFVEECKTYDLTPYNMPRWWRSRTIPASMRQGCPR